MYFPRSVRYKLWLKYIIICSKLQFSSHDNEGIELPMTFLFLGLLRRPAFLYMPDFYEGERALCSYPMVSELQKLRKANLFCNILKPITLINVHAVIDIATVTRKQLD